MNFKYLLLVLMLLSVSSATWQYSQATGEVCFDVNHSQATVGYVDNDWYHLVLISLEKNSTFWSDNLRAYHTATASDISLFVYADNGTHVFVALPLVNSLAADELDNYCIYSGDEDYNNITDVAPYGLGFDTEAQFNSLILVNDTPNYSITWNSGYVNITSDTVNDPVYTHASSAPIEYVDVFILAKMQRIASNTSNTNSILGVRSGYSSCCTNGWGVGIKSANMTAGWYTTTRYFAPYNDSMNIYHMSAHRGTGNKYSNIYNTSMSPLLIYNFSYSTTSFGLKPYINLMYVRNATAMYDWSFAADDLSGEELDWRVYNTSYDFADPNISIQAPAWNVVFTIDDSVLLRVKYLNDYDYCNITLNGNSVNDYSSVVTNQITNDVLNGDDMIIGNNEIIVSCDISGDETHKYWYFTLAGSSAEELFEEAFNISISEICDADVVTALASCYEYHKLETLYNFSAVACYDINQSKDYSCIGASNRTKNSYTIFWSPSTWNYSDDEDIPHIGAIFYYSGAPIDGRIELYSNESFMYIPAQTKPRDCEIYYSSDTTGCSYWAGFAANDRHVLISDDANNWFIAGTAGIVDYNITYSQLVIPTSVLPITTEAAADLFTGGIFTRANCRVANNSFIINIVNTVQQLYTVTVIGNDSFSYTFTSSALSDNISLNGTSTIAVTANNQTMCEYGAGNLLFLPFSIPNIEIDGSEIIVWVVLLFGVVLSAVIPFAMFIVVIINDIYSLLNPFQIGLIAVFAIVAGLVNNVHSMDRGVKHIIIIVAIVASYLSALSEYEGELGVTFSGYIELITQFRDLAASSSLWDFTFNLAGFVISLFVLVITLPAQFIALVYDLLYLVSPTLFTVAMPFRDILMAGFMIYFYLKAYEVISNRFRGV